MVSQQVIPCRNKFDVCCARLLRLQVPCSAIAGELVVIMISARVDDFREKRTGGDKFKALPC